MINIPLCLGLAEALDKIDQVVVVVVVIVLKPVDLRIADRASTKGAVE